MKSFLSESCTIFSGVGLVERAPCGVDGASIEGVEEKGLMSELALEVD